MSSVLATFYLSSANALNMDWSKILTFGEIRLMKIEVTLIPTFICICWVFFSEGCESQGRHCKTRQEKEKEGEKEKARIRDEWRE